MVYCANRWLTDEEMAVNAQYILDFMTLKGWTKNAICGMLGNMQSESKMNPGIWQSLKAWNMSVGFGLVQWTPAYKYFDWARGYYNCTNTQAITMDRELTRICYEVDHNLQWIASRDPQGRTFAEFTQSNDTAYELGRAFVTAYERPKDQSESVLVLRGTRGQYWYDTLVGGTPGGDGDLPPDPQYPPDTNKGKALMHMLLADAIHGWK